jgi:hypothetical protein
LLREVRILQLPETGEQSPITGGYAWAKDTRGASKEQGQRGEGAAATGLKKPDVSILSDEFLAEVRGMPHKNLAVELLRQLLNDEIRTRSRENLVQSRSFAEMLEAPFAPITTALFPPSR